MKLDLISLSIEAHGAQHVVACSDKLLQALTSIMLSIFVELPHD